MTSASPIGNETSTNLTARAKECHATFTGIHSYGGGGPGQAPVDYTLYSIDVTGHGKHFHKSITPKGGTNGGFQLTVGKAQYGGPNAHLNANWDFAGSHWRDCTSKSYNIVTHGIVGKGHISTGTVSETKDQCDVGFACS